MSELHSFGGSALDRHVFDFETVESGDVGGEAGAAPSSEPVAETEPGETEASTVETEAAPAWTPEQIATLRDHPEFRDLIAEEASVIADARMRSFATGNTGEPNYADQGEEQFDPNAFLNPLDDNFGQNLLQAMQYMLQQAQAPYVEQRQAEERQETNQRVNDIVTDTISRNGELLGDDITDRVRQRAVNFANDAERLYGTSPRAMEYAIEKAYHAEKAYQKSITEKAIEQHVNRNSRLADLHGEPGTGANGVEARQEQPYRTGELARKYGRSAAGLRG